MNNAVLRGNKFNEYILKEPIDATFYDGEIWNPSINESIVGEYIAVLTDVGRYNQNMYIIDTDRLDGKYDKLFGYASLDRQMKEIKPHTIIEIKYTGYIQKQGTNGYHEYKVSKLRKQ